MMHQRIAPPGYGELRRGCYLTALQQLRRSYASPETTPTVHNFLMWALNAVDPWGPRASEFVASPKPPAATNASSAVEEMLRTAMDKHRVVILQERHALPESRYFGARMIQSLAAAGATHLAFEHAAQASFDEFSRTGVVRPGTEAYAFDPSRAAILRAARDSGLTLVAFDFPPGGQLKQLLGRLRRSDSTDAAAINRERERYMADNIVRLILKPFPRARAVVWTGEQHAMKRVPNGWWGPFMAMHLESMTDEAPFCVGQEAVDCSVLSAGPRYLDARHALVSDRGVDAIILHHRAPTAAAPAWVTADAATVRISVDRAELVQAIPQSEGEHAVPAVQQLTHGATALTISIPPGSYLLRGLSGSDTVIWRRAFR